MKCFREAKVSFGLLVILIVLFTLIFTNKTVYAGENEKSGVCGDNLSWELNDDGELIISGTGDMYDYEEGAPWSNYQYYIKKIIINEGATSIGETAFCYCYNAREVLISDTVSSIGYQAFWCCEGIESVSISRNVKTIGTYAFGYCESLKSIEVDADNQYYYSDGLALYNKNKTVLYQYALNSDNKTYTVPESVTKLYCVSFACAKNLKALYVMSGRASAMTYTFAFDTFNVYCHKNSSLYTSIQEGGLYGNVVARDIDAVNDAFDDIDDENTDDQPVLKDNISFTFQDADGNNYSTDAYGKTKVLIFGRENCGNTIWTLEKLKDKHYKHSNVDIFMVDIESSEADALKAFADNYYVEGLSFVTADEASMAMWKYVQKFPGVSTGGSVTLPIIVYINSDNKLVDCKSGPEDVDSTLRELFGLYENDEEENAKTDENDQGIENTISSEKNQDDDQLRTISFNVTYHQTEARSMLDDINEFRQDVDNAWYWDEDDVNKIYSSELEALEYDYDLEKIAMQRVAEISLSYEHLRPNGTYVFDIMDGYMCGGENIAYGQTTANEVFVDWREDDYGYSEQGHRRNMLSDNYNCVGIACAEYQGRKFWVQVFGYTSKGLSNTTVANNFDTLVTIQALEDNIIERGFYSDTDTYRVEVEECMNIQLPQPYVKLVSSSFAKCPINADCKYIVVDDGIATIDSNQICGLVEGTTGLKSKGNIAGKELDKNFKLEVYSHPNPVEGLSPTCYENLYRTYPAADGSNVSTTANCKPKLIIFYNEGCYWCSVLFQDIANHPDKYNGVDILAIDMYGSDLDTLRDYASSYGDSPITFCSGEYDLPFEYVRLWNKSSSLSVGTPFTIFVNKDNLVVYNLSGYVNNFADYVSACFSEDWNNKAKACEQERKEQENKNNDTTQSSQNEAIIPNNEYQSNASTGSNIIIPIESGNDKTGNTGNTGNTVSSAPNNTLTVAQQNVVKKQNVNSKKTKDTDYDDEDEDTFIIKKATYEIMSDNSVILVYINTDSVKSYTVPDTVTYNNKKYKVSCIYDEAFINCKELKRVTIGKNIEEIGDSAFKNCISLKNITVKTTKLTKTTIGKNAFKGISKKATITVPKKRYKNYKKWLKNAGLPKGVKIKKK